MLKGDCLQPFHFQQVEALNSAHGPFSLNFCQWVMQQYALAPDFIGHVLFTAEATFSSEGVFNEHNSVCGQPIIGMRINNDFV